MQEMHCGSPYLIQGHRFARGTRSNNMARDECSQILLDKDIRRTPWTRRALKRKKRSNEWTIDRDSDTDKCKRYVGIPGRKWMLLKPKSHKKLYSNQNEELHVNQVLLDQFTLCIFVYYIHNLYLHT